MTALYEPYNGLYSSAELRKINRYLKEELQRSMKSLRRPGRPRVYYLSYLFRNQRQEKIWGRLGAINRHDVSSSNTVFCDLRVGSYRYDNLSSGGLGDDGERNESNDYVNMPVELGADAFKFGLWKLTDARYREAAEQYYEKKSREMHFVNPYPRLQARVKRPPRRDFRFHRYPEVDIEKVLYLIRRAGNLIKKYTKIKNSWLEFIARHNQNILVNSEESDLLQQSAIFELRGHLWLLNSRGEAVTQEFNLVEGEIGDLPDEKEFLRIIRSRIDLLLSLEKAPLLTSYSGPVMLSPEAGAVFFHEVLGHRLEGSRLLSPDEGSTFQDLYGKKIAPEYIDILDDPNLTRFGNRNLIGAFKYDDEGTPAQRTVLVEGGILKNFLSTSAPLPHQKGINGHARNQRYERPISRMGNLIVQNRQPVSEEDMRRLFQEEIRKRKKPYGIYVKNVAGGETETSAYDFQAFKGEIMHAVRVFPGGREQPIRGVDFVGTPLSALDSVICLGDNPEVDNSFCGAESGVVPVSTIAPSMLLSNLELQSRTRERFTQYVMPLPFGRDKS